MNTLSNLIAISHDRKLPALSLFLMLLWLPQQVMAVDELGLFELDRNFADDAATFDSCGWDVDGSGTVEAGEACPAGWTDNVPASSTFDLRDGLVDINEDGVVNTSDVGTVTIGGTSFLVKKGFIDRDGDGKVGFTGNDKENDNGDT
ncbi:MAG: hypothetical protein HKO64_00065, partial [Xanthomonadales bacterium]|nr:hypothetical protein [Xanthomonadales bacterium]